MDREYIKDILNKVKEGNIDVDLALNELKNLPFEEIEDSKIDHHRSLRGGFPEVIFSQGKTTEQIVNIFLNLTKKGNNIMATRASKEVYDKVKEKIKNAIYYETARIILANKKELVNSEKMVAVITAGTADIPVAEEAAVTLEVLGNKVERIFDVGVAGIHRLFAKKDIILSANVSIVVAGMEGALASVVGGLVDRPVIAVPTSVGYGACFGGLAPLLTMLNSCATGVGVVNIDNGFGAGVLASQINKQ